MTGQSQEHLKIIFKHSTLILQSSLRVSLLQLQSGFILRMTLYKSLIIALGGD